MDEIEYKLGSNNPMLISHAVSKLLGIIKQKSKESDNKDVSRIPEMKILVSKCESENTLVSTTAYQGLVILAQSGVSNTTATLSNCIASLGTTKNYTAVTAAIANLLMLDVMIRKETDTYICPFTLRAPQHPLITILSQKKDIWRDVLTQMQFMTNHYPPEIARHSTELLRPVFLHILCNPRTSLPESCKQLTWHLLIKTSDTLNLVIEVLQWLRTSDANACVDTNYRYLELAEVALAKEDKPMCSALLPLVTALAIRLLEFGSDPRPNLDVTCALVEHSDNDACSITVMLLSEIIAMCPATYLVRVIRSCTAVLGHASCNSTVSYALMASLLQWLMYPSLLSSDVVECAQSLIDRIKRKPAQLCKPGTIRSNGIFAALRNVDPNVQFYAELCYRADNWSDEKCRHWLDNLSRASSGTKYRCRFILAGVFLRNDDFAACEKACGLLLQISKENNEFTSRLLSLILYKLTRSCDFTVSKILLFALPELATVKENVPIIVHTLKTLLAFGKPLKQLSIELYLRTWEKEPRCYRYLYAALVDSCKMDHAWQTDVVCAKSMKRICETRPEHGAELVPLLSQMLNRCSNTEGGTASALALEGISALCVVGVIDICSTWKILKPRMNRERRTIVLKSLCELFGEIPSYSEHPSDKIDELIVEIVTLLWTYVSSSDDVEVAKSALKALASYKLEQIPLKSLPTDFTKDLPGMRNATKDEAKLEDVLSYVPGVCWIGMLAGVCRGAFTSAGDLLIAFVRQEVGEYRSGMYEVRQELDRFDYLPKKSVVRAIGECLQGLKKLSDHADKERITVECLRIFSQRYPKPLPPVKWNFLEKTMEISDEARMYSLTIACRQAFVSPSAKSFIEKYLTTFVEELKGEATTARLRESLSLHCYLNELCLGTAPNVLRPFLDASMNLVLEKALRGNESWIEAFREMMCCYKRALEDDNIHDANRTVLAIILEGLLDKIDADCKLFESFVSAATHLSTEHIERVTSPNLWWEVTVPKLKKAVIIRAALVLKRNVEMPLVWMNDVIDAAASLPGTHAFLLQAMEKVQFEMGNEKSIAKWILDLMTRIQILVGETENDLKTTAFLCDILFVSVICLSHESCLLVTDDLATCLESRAALFPQAVARFSRKTFWKDIISQIMEWLSHMRTSSVPELYRIAFHNALVTLRHEEHFCSAWAKYLSVEQKFSGL